MNRSVFYLNEWKSYKRKLLELCFPQVPHNTLGRVSSCQVAPADVSGPVPGLSKHVPVRLVLGPETVTTCYKTAVP